MSRYFICVFAVATLCSCQTSRDATFHGNLPQALLMVDQHFHVSVVAELVDPVPSNLSVQIKPTMDASAVVTAIVARCPGYVWTRKDGVFLIAQKTLLRDSANPMNQVVPEYQIPNNLSLFKLSFPNAVAAAALHVSGSGGLLNGFSLPDNLSPSLIVQDLHNKTAREILLHVAREVGNLYSVLILPDAHPEKQRLANTDFRDWEIAGGAGIEQYKTRF
ncbi:hypothetical protein [Pseudacidobacterium ailaaui]|jgi:hypothetical protein|uniref:hypothetical protein n=1 Tax=Pseudacidobacterium ailaaui TaxID=1382359 RepID=UPI0012DD807E|nr:hypothetical protein [Pseudacidobacterium ailaaui]MBX6361904.1 hypothetical protein [Pseudacidobacterium ailaaui]